VGFSRDDAAVLGFRDVVDRDAEMPIGRDSAGGRGLKLGLDERHEVAHSQAANVLRHFVKVADVDHQIANPMAAALMKRVLLEG
jgi:hypothetical protein